MNPFAQRLLKANQKLYREAANPLKSHGPDHHLRVYRHALALANKLGVTYDDDVLAAAALFHDLAAYYPDKTGEHYHEYDHKIANQVLEDLEFPKEKIALVLDAIAHHGSDQKYKQSDEAIETTLLRDADKLDVFGPIGIARIIMVRTLKGDTLDEIVDDFWTNSHLERKWQSISTDAARQMAESDYEYSKTFFIQLDQALSHKAS